MLTSVLSSPLKEKRRMLYRLFGEVSWTPAARPYSIPALTPQSTERQMLTTGLSSYVLYSCLCWLPSSCESSIGIPIEFSIFLRRARTKLDWEFATLYSVVDTNQMPSVDLPMKRVIYQLTFKIYWLTNPDETWILNCFKQQLFKQWVVYWRFCMETEANFGHW
jgi:hypothetical protein